MMASASHILFASDLAKQLVELCDGGPGPLPYQAIRDLLAKIPHCAGGGKSFCEATKDHPFLHRFVSSCSENDDAYSVLEIVRATLDLCPGAANVASAGDGDGYSYPLHEACNSPHTPDSVIELLVSKSDRSVFTHLSVVRGSGLDESKETATGCPLHYYIMSGRRNVEIIRLLATTCPEALAIAASSAGKNNNRATPLHAIVQDSRGCEAELVKCLVESNPSAVRIRGAQERLPVHSASWNGDLEVVKLLLGVWPGSAYEKDTNGRLPLHLLCINEDVGEEMALSVMKVLVDQAPNTVREKDDDRGLPATYAAIYHQGLSCCKYLIKMSGGDEPSQLLQVLENLCDLDWEWMPYKAIRRALAIIPDFGADAVREAMKKSHILHHFVSRCYEDEDDEETTWEVFEQLVLEIVTTILDLCPELVNTAAGDHGDSYPLHAACCCSDTPDSVIELLLEKGCPSILSHLSITGFGVLGFTNRDELVAGTPLHYSLTRKEWDIIDVDTVKLLVEACPEALMIADSNSDKRSTPLHAMLRSPFDCGGNADVVEFLIRSNPSAVRTRDGHGCLPIHSACYNRDISLEVVKLLLEAWPESVREFDGGDAGLPLHYLCYNSSWWHRSEGKKDVVDVLKHILAAAPETARERFINGYLPIQIAAAYHCAEFLRVLIDYFPGSERIQDDECPLPIFRACQSDTAGGGGAVKYLLELYPESARMKFDGKCPLETALCSQDNWKTDIVESLLSFDPSLASKEMSLDPFPLHVACEHACDVEVLKILFDAHPAAILATDPDGETPLDLATDASYKSNDTQKDVVSFLEVQHSYALKAGDRHALTVVDENNRLLLHRTLHDKSKRGNASLGAIKLIANGNPNALRIADNHGLYPAHIAIVRSSLDVTRYILDLDGSVLESLDEGGNTALHYACRGGNCEVVKFLLEGHASMALVPNKRNELPLHLLCDASGKGDVLAYGVRVKYLDALWQLLLAYPGAVSTASSGLDEA